MLRPQMTHLQERPRKNFSLDVLKLEDYNQFKGEAVEECDQKGEEHIPDQSNPDIHH